MRDSELASALRGLANEPPMAEVDWAGLESRIAAAAELPLARRRRARPTAWWQVAGRRSWAASAAAAAGIALAVAAGAIGGPFGQTAAIGLGDPVSLLAASAIAEEPATAMLFILE